MSDARHMVSDLDVDLGQLFSSILRNWLRILLVALAVAGLAYVLLGLVTPLYRAETRILIESRASIYTRPASAGINDAERAPVDDEMVASQVEVIGSTDILRDVARQLDLASFDEFGGAGETSTFGNLLVLLGLKSDPTQDSTEERVLRAMQKALSVYRVDGSRVIVISFSSQDPALAAEVPNAIADAYVARQEQARRLSDAEATDWLEPEIEDLRQRLRQAEARVAEYRAQAGLLLGQNNSVLPTQQLAELSSELTRVSAERAAAEARAKAISNAMGSTSRMESMPEILSAPMVLRLRERQVQLEASLADLSASLLDNHPRMKALRAQLDETGRQLRAEMEKVRLAAQNEASTAKAREDQLVAEVNRLKASSAQAGDDEVELRALEREAAAERALLESYLTRYREAASRADRNSMPADARIFERATPPHQAYFPKRGPIIAAAFVASILLMSIAILLRELFSGRAMRPAAGAFGSVSTPAPMPVPVPVSASVVDEAGSAHEHSENDLSLIAAAQAAADEILRSETETAQPESEDMSSSRLPQRDNAVSEAVNRLVARKIERAIFISPQGDEATIASVTVAREMADTGLRVIFVDLTWSGAPSAAMLEEEELQGITDLLAAQAKFADAIHGDVFSDCHVIPAGTTDRAQAMDAIDRLPVILEALNTAYEIVVIECGATNAQGIASVISPHAELIVSALDPDNPAVTMLLAELYADGYRDTLVLVPDISRPTKLRGKGYVAA